MRCDAGDLATDALAFIDHWNNEGMRVPPVRECQGCEGRNPPIVRDQNQASRIATPASRIAARQFRAVRISTDTQPLYPADRKTLANRAWAAACGATGARSGALAWQC